jgi:lipid A 3-O-deacylase
LTAMAQVEKAKDYDTVSIYVENDVLAASDSNYTSGFKLTWTTALPTGGQDDLQPKWDYPLIRRLPFVKKPGFQRMRSLSIGQSVFTPEDLRRSDLIVEDRPYAGFSYLGIAFHSSNSRRMDSLEFDIGIVGRHSYGEDIQKTVHKWTSSTHPEGWDNQLKDEFALNVTYESKWKLLQSGLGKGFGYDLIPHLGGRLGNVHIYANAGMEARFGWSLPNDYGTCPIRPGCEINTAFDAGVPSRGRFGIHIFVGVDGRAVARDIFLDGNTFRDSHSVDKEHFVADIMAGMALRAGGLKITYAFVYRTKEFKTQDDEQIFGSILLSLSY